MRPFRASILVALAIGLIEPARGEGSAAPSRPTLSVEFEETEAVPGQPLSLRLTVLVPTYMPKPPVWPSLEAPNVLVRLPERSTNPTSARVGGATWSGVSRHYRITPMVPGPVALPPQEVVVTYADPDTNAPVEARLLTEAIAFAGVVPEGAEDLDPFLAAAGLTLQQTVDGEPGAMKPGDSVTRTVTARVEGTPSMFIPGLLPPADISGVAAYPAEPVTADTEERGTVTGTRTESVTYVAEGGGRGEVPPISLGWYDLAAGSVRTAMADGFAIAVDGPPVATGAERDWRAVAAGAVGLAVVLSLLALAAVRLAPAVRRRAGTWRASRVASEAYAWRRLRVVIGRRDIGSLHAALDLWAERIPGTDPRRRDDIEAALVGIGAARYGAGATEDPSWAALARAVADARHDARRRPVRSALPPLNPAPASP
jgi:hypothetical protein